MKEFFETDRSEKVHTQMYVPDSYEPGVSKDGHGRNERGHLDNDRGKFEMANHKSDVHNRNADLSKLDNKHAKVEAILARLDDSLTKGAKLLEKNEIAAALDCA